MVELCGLMSDNDQKLKDLLQETNLINGLPGNIYLISWLIHIEIKLIDNYF